MISTRAMCFCYYFMSGTVSRIPDPSHTTSLRNKKKHGIINDIPYESLMHVGCGAVPIDVFHHSIHLCGQNYSIIHGVLVQCALHFRINYANAFMNV